MVGLITIGIVVLYLGLTIFLISMGYRSNGRKRWVAIVCFLAAVLIPFGDIPFDKYRFNRLCEKEGGIFVYQKVGLSKEYYLAPGETTKKMIVTPSGDKVLSAVPAIGDELRLEKVKEHFIFEGKGEKVKTGWGEIYKSTTKILEGNKVLGKHVYIFGGGGWFSEKYNFGPRRPGVGCSKNSLYEELPYKVFFELETNGVVENGNSDQ